MSARERSLYAVLGIVSGALVAAAWQELVALPLDKTEVLAFVTGAWAVWLAVRNNIWNWPIGIANSAFFVVLFWQARLYFDMGINVFYVASGIWGWALWAAGGPRRSELPVGRVGRGEAIRVGTTVVVLTAVMGERGVAIDDAAPFLDALTTALSIAAQWLLMRRLLENWYLWIAADLIYIPLYFAKDLPLTAVLYVGFLLMCLRGWSDWRRLTAAPAPVEITAT